VSGDPDELHSKRYPDVHARFRGTALPIKRAVEFVDKLCDRRAPSARRRLIYSEANAIIYNIEKEAPVLDPVPHLDGPEAILRKGMLETISTTKIVADRETTSSDACWVIGLLPPYQM
jgi:hypothetical protein